MMIFLTTKMLLSPHLPHDLRGVDAEVPCSDEAKCMHDLLREKSDLLSWRA